VKGKSEKMNKRGGDKEPVDRRYGDWLGVARVGLEFPSTAAEP